MDNSLQDQNMYDDFPLFPVRDELPSPGQAMLHGTTFWEESVHNLRYGLSPRKAPEHFMAYQGPAQHKPETDQVMTLEYKRFAYEWRKAEFIKYKVAEKRDEIEAQRRRQAELAEQAVTAERANILEQSRQKAMSAQQRLVHDQTNFVAQHPQFQLLAPQESRPQGLGQSRSSANPAQPTSSQETPSDSSRGVDLGVTPNSALNDFIDPPVQQHWRDLGLRGGDRTSTITDGSPSKRGPAHRTQYMDDTITSSPAYRPSPSLTRRNATGYRQNTNPAITPQVSNTSHALGNTQLQAPISATSPAISHQRITRSNSQSLNNNPFDSALPVTIETVGRVRPSPQAPRQQTTAEVYTPSPSVNTSALNDSINVTRRRARHELTPTITTTNNEPTSPTTAAPDDDQEDEMIGTETSSESEEDDGDDDGDSDFDPRGKVAKPPGVRDIKGFGMRTRRSSGRGRR